MQPVNTSYLTYSWMLLKCPYPKIDSKHNYIIVLGFAVWKTTGRPTSTWVAHQNLPRAKIKIFWNSQMLQSRKLSMSVMWWGLLFWELSKKLAFTFDFFPPLGQIPNSSLSLFSALKVRTQRLFTAQRHRGVTIKALKCCYRCVHFGTGFLNVQE